MTVKFSKYTPKEPDWKKEIARLRACADVYSHSGPDIIVYDTSDVVFKFCASRSDNVTEILQRVKAANEEVGTPAAEQIDRDKIPQSVDYLARIGYAQGTIVSWLIPGVYPIWSAYRREMARHWEYRVAIWLTVLRDPSDISYLIGERDKVPATMFFRRQHVVRAVHADGVMAYDRTTVGTKHYKLTTQDDPYEEWMDDKATCVCGMVDYDTAEDLACTHSIDTWAALMQDSKASRAAQDLASDVVKRYATDGLNKLHKL